MKRWKKWTLGMLALLGLLVVEEAARASIWGEENLTLVKMLAELMKANHELEDMSNSASQVAGMTNDLLTTYQRVNGGIEELEHYSLDDFLFDMKQDFYRQYPGFSKLQYASQRMRYWDETHTRSPFRAYEAITAVVGDVTAPLRDEVRAGRANVDRELILKGEAAGAIATAHTAEDDSEKFDRELRDLRRQFEATRKDPGVSQQAQAQATLLIAKQQGYIVRLLARTVRLDGVNAAMDYAGRMDAKNAMAAQGDEPAKFMAESLAPPKLIRFGEE
jgi:hypothetical protein